MPYKQEVRGSSPRPPTIKTGERATPIMEKAARRTGRPLKARRHTLPPSELAVEFNLFSADFLSFQSDRPNWNFNR